MMITDEEDLLVTNAAFELNVPSGRRFQHRISLLGKYSFSRNQPSYAYYRGLGYSVKYVSGYELYLVNGLDAVLGKYQLAYKLFERKTELGRFMPIPQFRTMPYTIYLSVLAETGYVNDPFTGDVNPLGNRWLFGGGPAISILMYNNFFFQFSYAGNHLGEWGLYIHSSTSF